jgi:hypothetical protein
MAIEPNFSRECDCSVTLGAEHDCSVTLGAERDFGLTSSG